MFTVSFSLVLVALWDVGIVKQTEHYGGILCERGNCFPVRHRLIPCLKAARFYAYCNNGL